MFKQGDGIQPGTMTRPPIVVVVNGVVVGAVVVVDVEQNGGIKFPWQKHTGFPFIVKQGWLFKQGEGLQPGTTTTPVAVVVNVVVVVVVNWAVVVIWDEAQYGGMNCAEQKQTLTPLIDRHGCWFKHGFEANEHSVTGTVVVMACVVTGWVKLVVVDKPIWQ